MWPDNRTLRGTASFHGLFSHCREKQYQGTAAVWQEYYSPCFSRLGYKELSQKGLGPPVVAEDFQPRPEGGGTHRSSSTLTGSI